MIVNLQNTGWEIIYHRAHALLAAQIAGHWDLSKKTYRLYETIAAIAHHDNLEKEWEDDQLTEAGAPLDFTLERETALEQLSQHVKESLYQGRWVALLISMHMCFLNQGRQDEDPDVAQFVQAQYRQQAQWRDDLGVSKEEAEAAYTYMRWCDRLSLILCQRQVPMGGRKLEITNGPDGQQYHIVQSESGDLEVAPWPFSCDQFTVTVDACYLSQLKFESNPALTAALQEAPRKTLTWTLNRPSDA
ncbi:DUF3891 family protein [Oscillatoria sp. CS-180]|uniref:DUF3891 family protein n=1 Tax=Oscillatoria sp. CS-180 TaxID=3021720 RepID=UPI002330A7C9|nr:DUF3891 family protein [Oscillatoria sp. CS-180]MDB9526694.1 DUF3891 family protein [Oscillatoria sp. CS-180]